MGQSEAKWASVLGYVAGILFLATFLSFAFTPSFTAAQAEQALARYSEYGTALAVQNVLFTLAVVAGIPFFLALRNALRGRQATWVGAATTFMIVAFVLFVALSLVQAAMVAALAGVYGTGSDAEKATAVVVATATFSLFAAFGLGFLALAAGLITYGLVMWNSKMFPNWVASAAIVAGIVGLVSLAIPFGVGAAGLVLSGILVILFVAWLFGSAFYLARPKVAPAA
ncbi:MAG: DUF4386 family protein [Euryarchaeota archaeon]|nr:DUF4386 family protein [Euryarchaeota archaeon]